jgi:hypothetical protein
VPAGPVHEAPRWPTGALTARMRLLSISAMYRSFEESTAIPCGKLTLAIEAGPPSPEKPPTIPQVPTTDQMLPLGFTMRMRWLTVSEM